jgi:hypothetical protein
MKFYTTHIIVVFLSFFISLTAAGQVNVRAQVDRDKILIGEPVKLLLQVYTPLGENVTWFNLDTIPGFEFIQKGKLDTIENVDNKKFEQTLVITSFDSGRIAVPPFELVVGTRSYYTDSVFVDVSYKDFDPAADYRDIKAIEEVEDKSATYIPWIIGVVTLICLGLIVWLLRKKKRNVAPASASAARLPPYEEAMDALEKLKGQGLADPIAAKNYYTSLNDILRVFLHRQMDISSLEKTNDELIVQISSAGISKDRFTELAQTLRMSDFVKFARYLPADADNVKNWDVIRNSIRSLNNVAEPEKPAAPKITGRN